MRLALLLLLAPLLASAQGLPGSESVILRVDAESIYAHLFRPGRQGPGARAWSSCMASAA